MRTDSPLLKYYYKHLPKAVDGVELTGCPKGYYYNSALNTCLPITTSASESTSINYYTPKGQKNTATTGQTAEEMASQSAAMGRSKQREKDQEKQRVTERKSAVAAKDKGEAFTLPSGETKKYDDMTAREKMYVSGKALEQRGRFNEDKEAWYDTWLNPLNIYSSMAGSLAEAPYEAKQTDSYMPYITSIGNPLLMGRMIGSGSINPLGKKFWTNEVSNTEFLNNMAFGIPGMVKPIASPLANLSKAGLRNSVDLFSSVGKQLRKIEKYGKLNNLSENEIKNMQMQQVGITSKQREGYFPVVSETLSEYFTPYGYENMGKRLLDIPRRIIKGETNTKKLSNNLVDVVMDQGKTKLSKPRYDAWRMYSGLPQEYGTFRLAETSPLNHSSYPKGSLDNTEHDLFRFEIDNESLVDNLEDLKNLQFDLNKLNNSTKQYVSDFGTTNVMGGHNKRFFNGLMEYNDIWDLNPGNLKVEKYFGKPFMSHGQVPYNIDNVQLALNRLIKKGEKLKEYPDINTRISYEGKLDKLFNNKMNNLVKQDIIMKKQKSGGLTPNKAREILHDKEVHGHPLTDAQRRFFGAMSKGNTMNYAYGGDISIPALTTKMPPLSLGGSIDMQPKQSPLLDYYLKRTGRKRMIR